MRIVILTSSSRSFAVECLPALARAEGVEIAMVVLSGRQIANRWKARRRQLRKTLKIGLLGALNGVRMRKWYAVSGQGPDLFELAVQLGIRLEKTPRINCSRTVELFEEADADLGLSLSNSYIASRVFSVPRRGMINVHHELLPEFQGAQSVIWPLYEGSLTTGYTIHKIDKQIDTGEILYRQEMPLVLHDKLARTVSENYRRVRQASAAALAKVVSNYDHYDALARPQGAGRKFTTPSIWQYLKIKRNFRRLGKG